MLLVWCAKQTWQTDSESTGDTRLSAIMNCSCFLSSFRCSLPTWILFWRWEWIEQSCYIIQQSDFFLSFKWIYIGTFWHRYWQRVIPCSFRRVYEVSRQKSKQELEVTTNMLSINSDKKTANDGLTYFQFTYSLFWNLLKYFNHTGIYTLLRCTRLDTLVSSILRVYVHNWIE